MLKIKGFVPGASVILALAMAQACGSPSSRSRGEGGQGGGGESQTGGGTAGTKSGGTAGSKAGGTGGGKTGGTNGTAAGGTGGTATGGTGGSATGGAGGTKTGGTGGTATGGTGGSATGGAGGTKTGGTGGTATGGAGGTKTGGTGGTATGGTGGTVSLGMVTTGLVAYWNFDEGTAATAADVVGDRDGSLMGGATWRTSGLPVLAFGNKAALEFDGIDDRVLTTADLNAVLGGTMSVSVWIKSTATCALAAWECPGITGVELVGGGNDIFIGSVTGNALAVRAGDSGSAQTAAVNDGAWHHLVFTRDVGTGALAVYLDGALAGSGSGDTETKTTPFFSIGYVTDSSQGYLAATLDDVRIYNRVLSANEVSLLAMGK